MFVCPMDPEVRSKGPGKCPRCGMTLVPGIPLISGLFDLIQSETLSAVTRLASGLMLLLMVALGLTLVTRIGEIDVGPEAAWAVPYSVKLALRVAASFISAAAFAMLFGADPRIAALAGTVAVAANSTRLLLIDQGTSLAAAAFDPEAAALHRRKMRPAGDEGHVRTRLCQRCPIALVDRLPAPASRGSARRYR